MGNTVTKESSDYTPDVGSSRDDINASFYASMGGGSVSQLSGSGYPSTPRSSRSRHHSHGGSKHRKAKREGYEMIIDANETVDGGYLFPQGVYHGGQDFKVSVVRDLIIKRKLAPFYKGLDSVEPEWSDEELLENVKGPVEPTGPPMPGQPGPPTKKQQIWLYRNIHECPICFLVYPRLNGTRCCHQDICTECFVQIKRNPPHPPYTYTENTEATDVLDLISEPAACPYCAQPGLGVTFESPPFEWGIPSSAGSNTPPQVPPQRGSAQEPRKRRPSVPLSHPSVVTIDMIRPDWEEKLASAHRRLARKSAAARALHRSALLPRDRPDSSQNPGSNSNAYTHRDASSLSDIVHASRSMSTSQTRALEQRMIDEAIKASLAQQ